MYRLTTAATIALLAAAPVLAQLGPVSAQGETKETTDSREAAIVADCSARKFETSIEIEKDGEKRLTRFKLCAIKDSDDAAWVKTLMDAKAKIAAHPDISMESKANLATQLDVEIAKYETASPASISPLAAQPQPVASETVAAQPAPPPTPVPTRPRLTIRCLAPGDSGAGGACSFLDRDTRLEIQADGDLGEGATLRFLRRGDLRGEIALTAMRQGQSLRSKLPPKLCAGVASTMVEFQLVRSSQLLETFGPYRLSC